jgi:formylglycine-generating enzyme required for sulfatase activity
MHLNKVKYLVGLSLCVIALGISNTKIQAQSYFGFWDNVDINFGIGVTNFHTDYESAISGNTDFVGIPFPFEGISAGLMLSKPLDYIESPDYNVRINFGINYQTYHSPSVNNFQPYLSNQDQSFSYIPSSIKNFKAGPSLGLSLEYFVTRQTSIEPFIGVEASLHNPTANALINVSRNTIASDAELSGANIFSPYNLVDISQTRLSTETDAVSNIIFNANAGLKISTAIVGNYRWFMKYSIGYFFDDYFDNTSEAISGGPNGNDTFTGLEFGFLFPINNEARQAAQAEQQIMRIDRKQVAKIERIQNIANLVTTDEDLRELQRIMSDKILLYDTPGVRFNELASKTTERREKLGNTSYEVEMIEVPGGSYIIGLTSVDELNIQVQGRKRVTINRFMIDKYEVSNLQYRIFLEQMGVPLGAGNMGGGSEPLYTVVENGKTIQEIVNGAGFDQQTIAAHGETPNFNNMPDVLMPQREAWAEVGLNDVIPWEIYFMDSYYEDHPVVCVNWFQAKLFSEWSGKRLPTESEWEYASRSGVSGRVYPWDGLEVQTKTGKYRANFKQDRGVYDDDGYAIMGPVDSYLPNDFGLYNMAGNVAEWVFDSWNPSYVVLQNVGTANFVSPSYDNPSENRKVHRGGSWQSTEFFIGVGVRNFQDKNTGTPFVGFRCAKSVTTGY